MSDKKGGNEEAKQKLRQYQMDHPDLYYNTSGRGQFAGIVAAPMHLVYYFKRMQRNYGWGFLATLTSTYFFVKGMMRAMVSIVKTLIFDYTMNLEGLKANILGGMISAPWAMKPLMGLMSDLCPILGWRKKWYCTAFALMGTACWWLLGTIEWRDDSLAIPVALMFMVLQLQVATADLLVEGQYAELMVKQPECGSDIVTWVWAGFFLGNLPMVELYGRMPGWYKDSGKDYNVIRIFCFLASASCLQNVLPFLFNWLGETRLPREEWGFQTKIWTKQRDLMLVGLVMGIAAVLDSVVSIANMQLVPGLFFGGREDSRWLYIPLLVWTCFICTFLVWFACTRMHKIAGKANAYMFVASATYISTGAPMSLWYRADDSCFLDGPQFEPLFFFRTTEYIGIIAGFMGTLLFQGVMSKYKLRPCFWVTTVMKSLASLWELMIVLRWNVDWGIPDKTAYMVGGTVVEQLISMLDFMPGVVMTSKLCPKGSESVMYAILAGFQNFGSKVSSNLGSFVISATGWKMYVTADPVAGKWCDNLEVIPYIVLFGQILFPCVSVPLTWWLIPDAYVAGTIIDEDGNEWPPREVEEGSDSEEGSDLEAPVKKGDDLEIIPDAQPAYDFQQNYMQAPAPTPVLYGQAPMAPAPAGYPQAPATNYYPAQQ